MDKKRLVEEFEKRFLKGTCFDSFKELKEDKTSVQVNAPRALIAVNLMGVWRGYSEGIKVTRQECENHIFVFNNKRVDVNEYVRLNRELECSRIREKVKKLDKWGMIHIGKDHVMLKEDDVFKIIGGKK